MTSSIDLLAINRGSVVAPAGCGKTQLITDALSRHTGHKAILVLTHTNAGVSALRSRLAASGVRPSAYRLVTLDGFAIRLISTFPDRSGHAPSIISGAKPNYDAIRRAAIELIKSGHITDVLKASYSRVFVDEYQDCGNYQHAMVAWLAQHLPTAVVGDPFQAIFDFTSDGLPAWEKVTSYFPVSGELSRPWRWENAGAPDLGQWLLNMRSMLSQKLPVDLRNAPGVRWIQLGSSDDEALRVAASSITITGDAKMLIIGDSSDPKGQRRFARKLKGAVTVEAVDLRDLTDFGRALNIGDPEALSVVAGFAENLLNGFGGEDLVLAVDKARKGTLGRDLTQIESSALQFENDRTFRHVADLLDAINSAGGVECYRPAVMAATQRALQLASGPNAPSFLDAAILVREQSRLVGRPLAQRSVGSTLLLKGLEAEVSVILDAETMNARNLYVAMTRGSQRVLVCSASPILNPVW